MASNDAAGREPGLVVVCWAGDGALTDALLHRAESSAACGNRPSARITTDLTTAAVADGNTLCPACEWPDGAQVVLEAGADYTPSEECGRDD